MIPGFTDHSLTHEGIDIAYSIGGSGPTLLMLHGFPQTRAMWAHVAPKLAQNYTVICPDLRGYGDSDKPKDVDSYTFRKMAQDQLALLDHLGQSSSIVIGHDRGARVAHRLALDAAARVTALCLMDIIPTHTLLSELRQDVALSYYHWFFLAQSEPLPETFIKSNPDVYFHSCLAGWGAAGLNEFDPTLLEIYQTAWRNHDTIRGMCNDYRAAVQFDIHDDTQDLNAKIQCQTLVLYGADGVMAKFYDVPETWAQKCSKLHHQSITGGHFFVDTNPTDTLHAVQNFLSQI